MNVQVPSRLACAFLNDSRMKFVNATKPDGKSGVWGRPSLARGPGALVLTGTPSAHADTIDALKAHPVIGGGAIERRYRKVVQPEIDAELGTVMDLMVEKHGTEQQRARSIRDDLVAEGHRPVLFEVRIGLPNKLIAQLGR